LLSRSQGNWKRPPKLNEDGTPALPKKKMAKGRQSDFSQEPQLYQSPSQQLPFQQPYQPPTPQQQYDYPISQHPASDDYPQQGQFDDPFSALPNHFQNGNGAGAAGAYDYDAVSSRGGSPQPTGPPMETEAEFAWRIEEARRKVWSVIAKKDIPRVRLHRSPYLSFCATADFNLIFVRRLTRLSSARSTLSGVSRRSSRSSWSARASARLSASRRRPRTCSSRPRR
jgi:hypothetical protein